MSTTTTRVKILDYVNFGSFAKIYYVELLDEHNKSLGTRCLKQEINWERKGLQYDVVRQAGLHQEIRGVPSLLTAEKVLLHHKYMFVLMEYLPNTFEDLLNLLQESMDTARKSQRDPLGSDDEGSDYEPEVEEEEGEETADAVEVEEAIEEVEAKTEAPTETSMDAQGIVHDKLNFASGDLIIFTHDVPRDSSVLVSCQEYRVEPHPEWALSDEDQEKRIEKERQVLRDSLTKTYKLFNKNGLNMPGFCKFFRFAGIELLNAIKTLHSYGYLHDGIKAADVLIRMKEVKVEVKSRKRTAAAAATKVEVEAEAEVAETATNTEVKEEEKTTKSEWHIELVLTDFDHARRLHQPYDIEEVQYYPISGPEIFFRKPVVSHAVDVRAVGLLLGNLLFPKEWFFPDPLRPEAEMSEDYPAPDAEDEEAKDAESDEDEGWGGVKSHQVDWFSDFQEARGLMQWLDDKGVNFDQIDPDTGKIVKISLTGHDEDEVIGSEDDEDDDADESDEDEVTICKTKGCKKEAFFNSPGLKIPLYCEKHKTKDMEEIEIDLDEEETQYEARKKQKLESSRITDEELDKIKSRFKYIALHPSNLDNFVDHILQRRGGYGYDLPYYIFRWWIQMFIEDPSLRPTAEELLKQIDNVHALMKFKPLKPTKSKPLKIPTETEYEEFNFRRFPVHNPASWKGWTGTAVINPISILHESEVMKQVLAAIAEVRSKIERSGFYMITYQTMLLALDCFQRLAGEARMVSLDDVKKEFIACLLLAERMVSTDNSFFYKINPDTREVINDDTSAAHYRTHMSTLLVLLNGQVDSPTGILARLHAALIECKEKDQVEIKSEEVQNLCNQFEAPITFSDLWLQISGYLLVLVIFGFRSEDKEIDLSAFVRVTHAITSKFVADGGVGSVVEIIESAKVFKQHVDRALVAGALVALVGDDEEEKARIASWCNILTSL